MLELSRYCLAGATVLLVAALVVNVVLVATRGRAARTRTAVLAGSGGPGELESVPASVPKPPSNRGAAWLSDRSVEVALVLMTVALGVRMAATGHAPFSNQYEFAISFAWGITAAQAYFAWRYRVRALSLVVLPLVLAMLLYASTVSAEAVPLMPALQNHLLLTLHVSTAILAYGAAAVAFGAAALYLAHPYLKLRGMPANDLLDEIAYRAVVIAFPLLTIMIILGAIWADIAWGRYWAWDPKETAALVTWLIYGAYLHARVVRDWRGRKSAWLLVVGFAAILFTYFSNLLFGGLHSYV